MNAMVQFHCTGGAADGFDLEQTERESGGRSLCSRDQYEVEIVFTGENLHPTCRTLQYGLQ